MPNTVLEVLSQKAAALGDKTALEFYDKQFSYRDIHLLSNKVANALAKFGISKGANVAIMLPNCPEFLFSWFGAAKLGAPVVPVNVALKGAGLEHILGESEAKALIVHPDYWEAAQRVRPSGLEIVISSDGEIPQANASLESILSGGDDSDPPLVTEATDTMMIMYSSGTTGLPKGVIMPQAQIVGGAVLLQFAGIRADDVLYTCLPLFHANAAIISVWGAIGLGTKLCLGRRFSASRFWDEVRQYGATEFNALGSMMQMLWNQPPKPDDADNPVRIVLSAACPKEIWRDFEKRFGVTIVEFYGTVEGGITMAGPDAPVGSIGKPLPFNEMKIVDENDNECAPYQVGEIVARPVGGMAQLVKYYKNPEATAEKTRGGWLRTGDYGYRDENGYFYFVDRKKDVIRRRGENISSYEVERIVNQHPSVKESAAYAVPSEVGEDEVMVAIVLEEGHEFDPVSIIKYCIDNMAYYQVPRYLRVVDSFEKTETHRIKKTRLREEGVTPDTWDREKAGIEVPKPTR
jgi:crotonobetaine/carnitine-CoA ligase